MGRPLLKILGIRVTEKNSPAAWACALGPWLAPLLIVVCDPQPAFWKVAGLWMAMMVPGLLATSWLFPPTHPTHPTHPLGRGVSRLGVGSILGLLLFGIFSWTGCMLHWTLSTVLLAYALAYVLVVASLCAALIRRSDTDADGEAESEGEAEQWPAFDFLNAIPWWGALGVLALIGVMFVGVSMASPPASSPPTAGIYTPSGRPGWWHGVVLGFVASACCAGLLAFLAFWRRGQACPEQPATQLATPPTTRPSTAHKQGKARRGTKQQRLSKSASPESSAPNRQWDSLFTGVLWCAVAGLTVYLMLFAYSDAAPYPGGKNALTWNVDDVAYVSEAVDYQYGEPLGQYEPTLGAGYSMSRSAMSPLMAPLVGAIARFSGASCAALHHSVMPPLAMLISISCFAAALMVIFRMHRWLVPVGLLVILVMILQTWDYARCVVEMLAYRAMQPKALHLSWIEPLQLATVILLVVRPNRLHLGVAVAVAFVGYLVHPFAAIVGVFWVAVLLATSVVAWRKSTLWLAVLLVAYGGLGGLYHFTSHRPKEKPMPPSGRVAGSAIQSRDLVRVDRHVFDLEADLRAELDTGVVTQPVREAFAAHKIRLRGQAPVESEAGDTSWLVSANRSKYRIRQRDSQLVVYEVRGQPASRLDPFWSFGWNTLFHASSLSALVLLGFGIRRREILCVGILGLAVLVAAHFEPLGKVLNAALPTSIFWRARWILPQLISMACLASVTYAAWAVLLRASKREGARGRGRDQTPGRALIASLLTLAMFGALVASTGSVRLEIAKPPKKLTKFSADMHKLVGLLGGTEASAFVWGPFLVNHELPQLMPHVKLVKSRNKWTRSADTPHYRKIVENVFRRLQRGGVREVDFNRLLDLYPIDHIVISRRYRGAREAVQVLDGMGWQRVGQAGVYFLYQKPGWHG